MEKESKILGFLNQKGGVGKTTMTLLTANAISQFPFNKKIIVVDTDYQGSAINKRLEDIQALEYYDIQDKLDSIVFNYGKEKEINLGLLSEALKYAEFKGIKIDYSKIDNENYLNTVIDNFKAFPYEVRVIKVENAMDEIFKLYDLGIYDYILVDMPGSIADKKIFELLTLIDYVFIPIKAGELDRDSTATFLEKMAIVCDSRKKNGYETFVNIVFNEIIETNIYKDLREEIESLLERETMSVRIGKDFKEIPFKIGHLKKYGSDGLSRSVVYQEATNTFESLYISKYVTDKKRKVEFENFIKSIINIIEN